MTTDTGILVIASAVMAVFSGICALLLSILGTLSIWTLRSVISLGNRLGMLEQHVNDLPCSGCTKLHKSKSI